MRYSFIKDLREKIEHQQQKYTTPVADLLVESKPEFIISASYDQVIEKPVQERRYPIYNDMSCYKSESSYAGKFL